MKKLRNACALFVATLFAIMMYSTPIMAAGEEVEMADMHELESIGVSVYDDDVTDSYGNNYSGNIVEFHEYWDGQSLITYDLNGLYKLFSAKMVCSTRTGSSAQMYVGIFADGELIYELKDYTRQKPAEIVELDVSGVGELTIKVYGKGNNSYLYFVDSFFTKSDMVMMYPSRESLDDLVIIDSKNCDTTAELFVDVFGNIHNGKTELRATWSDSYALFYLDERFKYFSGCIVPGNYTGKKSVSMTVKFYLDDIEVFSQGNITRNTAQIDFEIDVTNAKVLKILAMDSDYNGADAYIYVTDSILKGHEHTPGEWVVESEVTCLANGTQSLYCTECNELIKTEAIASTGHQPDGNTVTIKEATCSEQGEQGQHCLICGTPVEVKKIAMLEHVPNGTWVVSKEATCTEVGEEKQNCSVCGDVVETRVIEKKSHVTGAGWVVVETSTCSKEGLQQKNCNVCGTLMEEKSIEMLEHDFESWETVSGSVWNNPIVKERTCSECGETEEMEETVMPWLKPVVIVVSILLVLGIIVLIIVKLRTKKTKFRQ